MPGNSQVSTVGLSDMSPNIVVLPPISINKSQNFVIATALRPPPTRDRMRNFAIRPPPTRDRARTFPVAAVQRPETRDETSVDLISVTSDDYPEDENDDQVSFDEGRLQAWNLAEFQMQLLGAVAGMVLLFGCGLISTWAIADFIKDFQQNEDEWQEAADYNYDLFDKSFDDFWESRHVIIAMVVLSYNVGCIVGGILGAFITPLLPNRVIYMLGSVLMLLTGFTLTMHTTAFFCARSRLMAGLVCGLVQVTFIVQAAESTTKKVRRWMLIMLAYVNAVSTVLSTLIFNYYDGREQVTYTEHNTALYIIAILMCGCGIAAAILNFLFTKDTIPFHLMRREDPVAFEEISRLKSDHLSTMDIRYEYDRIRFDLAQSQNNSNRNLAARSNHKPLISMCCARMSNLVFTSVAVTLVSFWNSSGGGYDDYDENGVESTTAPAPSSSPETAGDDDYEEFDPLLALAICQGFRMFCSIAVMMRRSKYHFNLACYKLAASYGATLIVWDLVYNILAFDLLAEIVVFPVLIVMAIGFFVLPIPLDAIQLNQSADSYARIKNTWSLAFAIFVENFVQIFLIVQMDIMFGFYLNDLLSGATLLFCSLWLLKNMPNVVSIQPLAVAVVAQAKKIPTDANSLHI